MMAAGAQVLRLLVLAIGAIFRPKALLIAENLCLRQQLVVLQRHCKTVVGLTSIMASIARGEIR
jgi:hypothetical protein